jgi:hypothetical protein
MLFILPSLDVDICQRNAAIFSSFVKEIINVREFPTLL